MNTMFRVGAVSALLTLAANIGFAQPPRPVPSPVPGSPPVRAVDGRPDADRADESGFRARALIGSTVSLEGGSSAGKIEDFVLNNDGVIEYLIIDNGGKMVTVPWDAAKFNWTQKIPTAVINIDQQRYQSIPTFTAQQYPNFYAPTYRTEIYRTYGLTPGQNRRIERRIERQNP